MRQIKSSPVTEPRFNPRAAQMSLVQNSAQQSTAQTSQMSSRETGRAGFAQANCRENTIIRNILLFTEKNGNILVQNSACQGMLWPHSSC